MNDKFIDDLLDQPVPEPDPNARKIAINAAMAEFSQGIDPSTRPIEKNPSIRSHLMNLLFGRNTGRVFATIAVAFVAASVVFMLPDFQSNESQSGRRNVAVEPELDRQTEIVADFEVKESADATLDQIVVTGSRTSVPETSTAERERILEQVARAPGSKKTMQESVITPAPVAKRESQLGRQENRKLGPAAPAPLESSMDVDQASGSIAPPSRLDLEEEYAQHVENDVKLVTETPVSTFSIDVDTASYSLVRNQLLNGFLPAPTAVRPEEFINYFNYDYPLPSSKTQPFEPTITVLDSPWNEQRKLVHIGIKGYDIAKTEMPDSNLVFLLDVSGSMSAPNKLPLVKQSIGLLLDTLKPTDTVSIAVYAGAAGTVLEPTPVKERNKILSALKSLNAGGSTAGAQGIELAYQLAEQNFNKDSVNRIILATDGDFNVGQQSNEALTTLVERQRDKGVFLSVLGFGRNNYQDDMMQSLAQNGNGVAAYIDSLSEAKKVLLDEATSTLFTIAKDVKIQVEFNPQVVSEYRLVGYETRQLNRADFNNDKVDAGDIGAGHSVTAIYEITPRSANNKSVDEPRYAGNQKNETDAVESNEIGFLKIRYKLPDSDSSKLIEKAIPSDTTEASGDVYFSVAAASFAQLLKGGKHIANMNYGDVADLAQKHKGEDPFGYRSEFIQLVKMAEIAAP